MGMTIDDHIEILKSYHNSFSGFTGYAGNFKETIDVAVDIMNKYQKITQIVEGEEVYTKEEITNIFNDWYYTKDEVTAMLKELKTEIEELDTYDIERTHGLIEDGYVTTDVSDIIQQKINALKEE